MRQIQVGAWLWMVVALAATACSGGEFSTNEPAGAAQAGAGNAAESPEPADDEDPQGGSKGSTVGGGALAGKPPGSGGGTSSSGGGGRGGSAPVAPATGGAKAEDCATGSVTLRMLPSPALAKDYLCDASCGTGWLTITDAEGATAFSISAACGTASCDTCEVQTCGAEACLPTALGAAGSELVWSGTYVAKDTCGAHMACQRQACVKPGKYKARACAALNQGESSYGCMPQQQQLCAEAEFEFPSKEQVVLVLEK